MSVAEFTAWRRPGCSDVCTRIRVHVGARAYSETVEVHSPEAHETYGERVLGARLRLTDARPVRVGPLSLDPASQTVTVDGAPVGLTQIEARFMFFLAANVEALCSQLSIARAVWDDESKWLDDKTISHRLGVNVDRIRAKLGPARGHVETVVGRGYRLRREVTP